MDPIVGRAPEKRQLEEIYNSKTAEFVAVYGRRRVGKTFLIKNFFQAKPGIYFQTAGIYKGALAKQLARFGKEIGETFYSGASIKTPLDWMAAFDELSNAIAKLPKNEKITLFFDELPWMATRKSNFIAALEYFWNRHWADDGRIKLITCGSAASWIIKKIIKNKGGLHNRVTHKIKLLPFNLYDTALYLKSIGCAFDHRQILKLYMITGGVAFYLKHIKKQHSIDQNIDKLFFSPTAIFFDEFDEVFASLFENSAQYKEIITIIAQYKDGIPRSVIDQKNKLTGKGGRLTTRLEDLENTGFIKSYTPFQHSRQGLFYQISDEYSYFYLKWIDKIKKQLQQDKITKYWRSIVNKPEYFNWAGYVFENICYKHLLQIKKALDIEETSLASPWRYVPRKGAIEHGAQIDLLFDRTDAISLCEIKYTEIPFTIEKQYAEKLQKKLLSFKKITKTKKQLFLALISANGISKNFYSEEMLSGVVTLEDLLQQE